MLSYIQYGTIVQQYYIIDLININQHYICIPMDQQLLHLYEFLAEFTHPIPTQINATVCNFQGGALTIDKSPQLGKSQQIYTIVVQKLLIQQEQKQKQNKASTKLGGRILSYEISRKNIHVKEQKEILSQSCPSLFQIGL